MEDNTLLNWRSGAPGQLPPFYTLDKTFYGMEYPSGQLKPGVLMLSAKAGDIKNSLI